MTSRYRPSPEPLRQTLTRTVLIAVFAGAAVGLASRKLSAWPVAALLAFWPSFGGHWVEVFFLRALGPRISPAPTVQTAVRLMVWFAGGCLLLQAMHGTAAALMRVSLMPASGTRWPAWWLGGLAFAGIELAVHLLLQLRGKPNFYNGRG